MSVSAVAVCGFLVKEMMNKFVMSDIMQKSDFFKIDVFEQEVGLFKHLIRVKDIDIGY